MTTEIRWKEFVEEWFYEGIALPWLLIQPKEGYEKSDFKEPAKVLFDWDIEHNTKIKQVVSMMAERFEFIDEKNDGTD